MGMRGVNCPKVRKLISEVNTLGGYTSYTPHSYGILEYLKNVPLS